MNIKVKSEAREAEALAAKAVIEVLHNVPAGLGDGREKGRPTLSASEREKKAELQRAEAAAEGRTGADAWGDARTKRQKTEAKSGSKENAVKQQSFTLSHSMVDHLLLKVLH